MSLVVFNPFVVLFWVLITSFIPGALLALSLLKKYELKLFEKIFAGFAIGLVIPSLLAFLINLAGVPYSFTIAIASVLAFYLVSIYLFWHTRVYEQLSIEFKPVLGWIIPLSLVAVMLLSFWVRLQSYSPVFSELDPYFYVYSAQQLLTLGNTPFEDKTAWYPEILNDHRTAPAVSFMEANWYSFYTLGGAYDNYLLAVVSDVYPPLVSAFLAFFVYLLVSAHTRRSYGLISAALVSLMPVFVLKLAAGEIETQPYGFFALAMFFAFYVLTFKFKSKELAVLAAVSYAALSLGSASQIIAMVALILFIPLHGILLFLNERDAKELHSFLILNVIIVISGVFFVSILRSLYESGSINLFTPAFFVSFATLGFATILYIVKSKIKDFETSVYGLVFLVIAALLVFNFTPVGGAIKATILSGLSIAEYNYPLQRTIAEQPPAYSGDYSFNLGIVGDTTQSDSGAITNILPGIGNATFSFEVGLVNSLLGSRLNYTSTLYYSGSATDEKTGQQKPVVFSHLPLLAFVVFLPLSCILAFFRYFKGQKTLFLFFLVAIAPPAIIGLLKAKYIIYLGFLSTIAFGFIFGELEPLLARFLKKFDFDTIRFDKLGFSVAFLVFMVLGIAFSLAELYDEHFPSPLAILSSSSQPRFQDNPLALQDKFKQLCSQVKLAGGGEPYDICEAGRDPIGYASKGTNNQYGTTLCVLSIMKDPFAYLVKQNTNQPLSKEEQLQLSGANFRCQRINDYWIESMEWIRHNTERDSRTTSWWDYGHWINFFGQKNTVLRNDHASPNMIGRIAYAYLDGTLDDLKTAMRDYDSKYALFDVEIAGAGIGGKYHALNYLGCAWANETNVRTDPGSSRCEAEHIWENIYVPMQNLPGTSCVISSISNKTGVIAFYGINKDEFGNIAGLSGPAYCVGQAMLANGQAATATFYLDKKYENGDLRLNKANFIQGEAINDQSGKPILVSLTLLYTKDPIWLENGEVKDGYDDRKGSYYDSNLYRAFFLKDMPGFELVYESSQRSQFGGHVKIYKLVE